MIEPRLLPDAPLTSLDEYLERRGGQGLSGARHVGPVDTIAEITTFGYLLFPALGLPEMLSG